MATTLTGFRESQYLSGQGVFFLGDRDANGLPTGLYAVGNVSSAAISLDTTDFEHKESQTGARSVDLTLVQELSATLTVVFESIDRDNLALALFGTGSEVAAASVADEIHAAPGDLTLEPGGWVRLDNVNVDAGTIVMGDDATPTTTYELGKNYEVDEEHGLVFIYSTAEQTARSATVNITAGQDLYFDYDHGGHTNVSAFTSGSGAVKWAEFAGLNTVDTNRPVSLSAYRVQANPLAELALITDEISQMEVEMTIQQDSLRAAGDQFFSIRQVQGRFTSP